MGGIVVAKRNDDFFERVRAIQYTGGAVPSPFDCWLVLRGMRTLPWRMRAHSENATKVADVSGATSEMSNGALSWPEGHPGHDIAKKQMSDVWRDAFV